MTWIVSLEVSAGSALMMLNVDARQGKRWRRPLLSGFGQEYNFYFNRYFESTSKEIS